MPTERLYLLLWWFSAKAAGQCGHREPCMYVIDEGDNLKEQVTAGTVIEHIDRE